MVVHKLILQNFRSYQEGTFSFPKQTTIIVGPNTAGKTNILEALSLLSSGKSFRSEKDIQLIYFDATIARISGKVDETKLEFVLQKEEGKETPTIKKRYLVNGVSKRRVDYASHFATVTFSPLDVDIIIGSPSLRRNVFDSVLEPVDSEYRYALASYTKALRQRNALLQVARETGIRSEKQFEYWDNVLITEGNRIEKKREAFVHFVNALDKSIIDFLLVYDRSVISGERLLQYKDAEMGSGVTLVGPHRDDFSAALFDKKRNTMHDARYFGSRGQQRLIVLQLRLLHIAYFEQHKQERPVLLLDDIFSELDEGHINHVIDLIGKQQTIITTTHKDFIPVAHLSDTHVIELKKSNV